jgi:hypothetical protein
MWVWLSQTASLGFVRGSDFAASLSRATIAPPLAAACESLVAAPVKCPGCAERVQRSPGLIHPWR